MRDMKKDKNLINKKHWPKIPIVKIKSIEGAKKLTSGLSMEEGEKIVVSWKDIAVLKVSPKTPFYLGFMVGSHCQFLKYDTETENGMFGMRIGGENVSFFVLPKDLETEMRLELVEMVKIDHPKYKNLSLY
ncbi:MAG: hypothetical protein AAB632_03310 [Patescibacteria group bacterium]